ncbi:divalent-cation tolerance protein CutA [Nitrospira lenta]|uniref:CutA1 divalent ion tolerance protein n=1 Tax=Nitrospira lenta TaxID=1436998 RepID=A0A330L6S2_9BACT|nr:divalent-cation tolerance protein CutA [Nitrospira lenta]SPP65036.1 CutA1 divalent ion tolerance protein [Nitrospira lenta]
MSIAKNKIIIIFVTVHDQKEGRRISKEILTSRLAACVNIIPGIQSMYQWKGKIVQEKEAMLVLKTTRSRYRKLEQKIKQLHSYEVPEVIAIPLICGSPQYIEWVAKEVLDK